MRSAVAVLLVVALAACDKLLGLATVGPPPPPDAPPIDAAPPVVCARHGFPGFPEAATGLQPYALAAADLDGNGTLDLAVANYASNTVSVLAGIGDGTFAPQRTYVVGTNPIAIAIGALNGDGHPDLVVVNYTS